MTFADAGGARGAEPVGVVLPGPLLPIEATITTPLLTSRDVACAVGYCGHWRRRAEALVDDLHAVGVRALERVEDDVRMSSRRSRRRGTPPARLGGDALHAATVGADDARHVGAVAAAIVGNRVGKRNQRRRPSAGRVVGIADEVVSGDDARIREGVVPGAPLPPNAG